MRCAWVLAGVLTALACADAAAAAPRPNLAVTSVTSTQAGDRLRVTVGIRNTGSRRAPASAVRVVVSANTRLDATDRVLVRAARLAALRPGRRGRVIAGARLPALAPGAYRILACADPARRIRERSEADNCRASAKRLTVTAGPPSPAPPAGTPQADPAAQATPAPTAGATPSPTATATPTPTAEPNPVPPGEPEAKSPRDVTVTADAARAASELVGPAGATLTATAADGTVLTLTVPPGALAAEEEIELAPVSAIGGLPFAGGLTAGAQLAPEGLRLAEPATLEIEPPSVPAAQEATFFAWLGDGEDFHLYPPERGEPGLVMSLNHFSGYGVGSGTDAERAEQAERRPENNEASAEQRLAEILLECRTTGDCSPEAISEAFEAALRAAYSATVLPDLHDAYTSDVFVEYAVGGAFAWIMQVTSAGLTDEFLGEIATLEDAIAEVIARAYDRAAARCSSDPAAAGRMAAWLQMAISRGFDDRLDAEKLRKCLTFELEFESSFERKARHDPQERTSLTVSAEKVGYDAMTDVGGIPDDAWVDLAYDDVVHVVGIGIPRTYPSSTFARNEGCQVAIDDVSIRAANLGIRAASSLQLTLHLRGRPRECEVLRDEGGNEWRTFSFIRSFWSHELNDQREEDWRLLEIYWKWPSADRSSSPESFDAEYEVTALNGDNGVWSLEFDSTFSPAKDISFFHGHDPNYDFKETTTVTVRHGAAG